MSHTTSPAGAEVYIINPENGASVPEKFIVRFGFRSMGLPQQVSQKKQVIII